MQAINLHDKKSKENFKATPEEMAKISEKMKDPEFMFLPLELIPQEIQHQYNMQEFAHNGKVYFQIYKGMYGLPQAGLLANKQLIKNLAPFG